MNSLVLAAIAVLLLYLGYRFYGGWIERRIVEPNDDHPTPAFPCGDGVDSCPAEKPLLFGHHFSSIAGAGNGRVVGQLPLLNVMVATLFGMIMLKTFVLTTLDTATRLGRLKICLISRDVGIEIYGSM